MSPPTDICAAIQRVQAAADADADADAPGNLVTHTRLLNEIRNLQLAVETPHELLSRVRTQFIQSFCIRLAVEYGIVEYITARRGEPVTAAELSKHANADEVLICRIMRLVTYNGICREVAYGVYASNAVSAAFSEAGSIGAEKVYTDLVLKACTGLVDMVRKNELHQFPEGPNEKNAFEYTMGMGLFEYLEKDQEYRQAFDAYMGIRRHADALNWMDVYPIERHLTPDTDNDSVFLVDIGGGRGHDIKNFQERFPNAPGRLILQDLPSTIDALPSKIGKIEPMVHNFFEEQPIKGARFYFFRAIMHDWSDAKCRDILTHIVDAMDPEHSRLLIDEHVLPDTDVALRAASLDVIMMVSNSGIERNVRQWKSLLKSVGLDIVRIWPSKTGQESVIEAKKRKALDS